MREKKLKIAIWFLALPLCYPAYVGFSGIPMYLEKANPNTYHEGLMAGAILAVWFSPLLLTQVALFVFSRVKFKSSWWLLIATLPGVSGWAIPFVVTSL